MEAAPGRFRKRHLSSLGQFPGNVPLRRHGEVRLKHVGVAVHDEVLAFVFDDEAALPGSPGKGIAKVILPVPRDVASYIGIAMLLKFYAPALLECFYNFCALHGIFFAWDVHSSSSPYPSSA